VLLHSGTGDIAAVVTRYYGGVNLGKGGLVRAYGGAVQHALMGLPTTLRIIRDVVELTVGYADVEVLRRLLAEHSAEVQHERYGEDVTYIAALPRRLRIAFARELADRTAGRGRLEERQDEEDGG
jgi:putative IMPACT (imprinted ancient) family translation regulator